MRRVWTIRASSVAPLPRLRLLRARVRPPLLLDRNVRGRAKPLSVLLLPLPPNHRYPHGAILHRRLAAACHQLCPPRSQSPPPALPSRCPRHGCRPCPLPHLPPLHRPDNARGTRRHRPSRRHCPSRHVTVFQNQVLRRHACSYLSPVPRGVFPFKRPTAGVFAQADLSLPLLPPQPGMCVRISLGQASLPTAS
jgi:hypothetical protein